MALHCLPRLFVRYLVTQFCQSFVFSPVFFYIVLCVFPSLVIISLRKETAGCLAFCVLASGCVFTGVDPGFLERVSIYIKVWGILYADFTSFFLNIP